MKKLLLLALVVPMLVACGRAAHHANAPAATSTENETAPYSTGSTAIEIESITGIDATTDEAQITPPVGGSIAQIVEFYNRQAGAVKAAEKITIQKHDVREMDMEVPALIKSLMPSGTGDFDPNRNETITETFVNGKGTKDTSRKLNDFLPIVGRPYISQLKASHVQSANCAVQGEGWIVTIKLKDEPMDMGSFGSMDIENISDADRERLMDELFANSGYYACMDMGLGGGMPERSAGQEFKLPSFINPASIVDSMNMDAGFRNGTIAAVFDKEGRLISLTLSYNNYSRVRFLGMKMNADSASKQEYRFTW